MPLRRILQDEGPCLAGRNLPPDTDASPEPPPAAGGNGDGPEPLNIADELKDSYLTYAMSVIISRALPDVRDGLKPSQRRILVAMNDLGLGPTAATSKCAGIVGETMKRYHPHGDASIYPTLVRMAQDWNMRHPLIQRQGNFGSIAGLPPAAMRYTEARLSPRRRRDARRPRARHRRFHRQLRRQVPRAARPAQQVPQPARQRLRRHRGRHGHRDSAAQPARSLRRPHPPDRRPGRDRRSN